MTPLEPIGGLLAQSVATPEPLAADVAQRSDAAAMQNFGDILAEGLASVENRIDTANDLSRRFALDDSVPIHEVTIAIEQARLAVELMLQVRTQVLEGYRQIMNMQL